jgi:hypothetical protein
MDLIVTSLCYFEGINRFLLLVCPFLFILLSVYHFIHRYYRLGVIALAVGLLVMLLSLSVHCYVDQSLNQKDNHEGI